MTVEAKALPFKEAEAYWADKKLVTAKEFRELHDDARSRAFTVGGLSARDELAAVHAAMAQAIEKGETLADFKARIGDVIERQGWTGAKAHRIETIYRTNLQSAYMAGHYAQMKKVARLRPYWRYVAVGDRRTRPTHLALHGLVYRHDHPFWDSYYPPNGFRCRCSVQTLSARQVEARGYEVQEELPELIEPVDPITKQPMPPVRPVPDQGFEANVGQGWIQSLTPEELDARGLRFPESVALCRDGKGLFADSGDACTPPLTDIDPRHVLPVGEDDILPEGLSDEEYVRAFLKAMGVPKGRTGMLHRLPTGDYLPVSEWLFRYKTSKNWKVQKEGRERYMRLLAQTILRPYEIWLSPLIVDNRLQTSLRLIRLFRGPDGRVGGYSAFHWTGRRWAAATAFTPYVDEKEAKILRYVEKLRVGVLLYREELD